MNLLARHYFGIRAFVCAGLLFALSQVGYAGGLSFRYETEETTDGLRTTMVLVSGESTGTRSRSVRVEYYGVVIGHKGNKDGSVHYVNMKSGVRLNRLFVFALDKSGRISAHKDVNERLRDTMKLAGIEADCSYVWAEGIRGRTLSVSVGSGGDPVYDAKITIDREGRLVIPTQGIVASE